MQEKWKHTQAQRVGSPSTVSQLVPHVSEHCCTLGGINLNKTIKSEECPILSTCPGCLLLPKLTGLNGILLCNQQLGLGGEVLLSKVYRSHSHTTATDSVLIWILIQIVNTAANHGEKNLSLWVLTVFISTHLQSSRGTKAKFKKRVNRAHCRQYT